MDSLNRQFTARREDFDQPVLVTGSGGCIGSWALAILVRAGVPAVAFDLDASRWRPGLLSAEEDLDRVVWEQGDIADPDTVDRVVSTHGIGAIIHLAGLQVPFCAADPVGGARVNVIGTATVFEATARVYWRDWGVPSAGIRPGVVCGVGRDQGITSKTTVAILAAAAGREYEVPFRGAVSYLYAGEVASAFVHAVSRDREGAPVFDCVGRSTTVEGGLAALRRLVPDARVSAGGDPLPFPFEDRDALLREHIGDYVAISVEEGTAETLRAFRVLLQDGRMPPDF